MTIAKRPLVDHRCYELAEHFMQDEAPDEDETWRLARMIQQAVEDWHWDREHRAGRGRP